MAYNVKFFAWIMPKDKDAINSVRMAKPDRDDICCFASEREAIDFIDSHYPEAYLLADRPWDGGENQGDWHDGRGYGKVVCINERFSASNYRFHKKMPFIICPRSPRFRKTCRSTVLSVLRRNGCGIS